MDVEREATVVGGTGEQIEIPNPNISSEVKDFDDAVDRSLECSREISREVDIGVEAFRER